MVRFYCLFLILMKTTDDLNFLISLILVLVVFAINHSLNGTNFKSSLELLRVEIMQKRSISVLPGDPVKEKPTLTQKPAQMKAIRPSQAQQNRQFASNNDKPRVLLSAVLFRTSSRCLRHWRHLKQRRPLRLVVSQIPIYAYA